MFMLFLKKKEKNVFVNKEVKNVTLRILVANNVSVYIHKFYYILMPCFPSYVLSFIMLYDVNIVKLILSYIISSRNNCVMFYHSSIFLYTFLHFFSLIIRSFFRKEQRRNKWSEERLALSAT